MSNLSKNNFHKKPKPSNIQFKCENHSVKMNGKELYGVKCKDCQHDDKHTIQQVKINEIKGFQWIKEEIIEKQKPIILFDEYENKKTTNCYIGYNKCCKECVGELKSHKIVKKSRPILYQDREGLHEIK